MRDRYVLTEELADCFRIPERRISLLNWDSFCSGGDRFLLGHTGGFRGRQLGGFIKLARNGDGSNVGLKRESSATSLAKQLGIPTVRVLLPYEELSGGEGVVLFERLSRGHGMAILSKSQLTHKASTLGDRAAIACFYNGEKIIPKTVESSFLRRDDARNMSSYSFLSVWKEAAAYMFKKIRQRSIVDKQTVFLIGKEADEALKMSQHLLPLSDGSSHEVFSHNDIAPSNMLFWHRQHPGADISFVDFEHAGATHNRWLAHVTGIADFYRSCGLNNAIRMRFISKYFDITPEKERGDMSRILQLAMIFGVLLHGGGSLRDRLSSTHPEHDEMRQLLDTLPGNLDLLRAQAH